jgi:hypothetical protein
MPFEAAEFLPAFGVPESESAVIAAGEDPLAVG